MSLIYTVHVWIVFIQSVLVGFTDVEVMHCDASSAGCDRSQLHRENTSTHTKTTFQYSNSR